MKEQQATYRQRNITLKDLGYSTYTDYLSSPMWTAIRDEVIHQGNGLCRICHGIATSVHHIGYGKNTLLGMNPTALVPVCNRCHYRIEFDKTGQKRTLKESERTYRKMWRVSPFRKRRKQPKVR